MSEKSQEEPQSFANFLALVKKLEGIIQETPDKEKKQEEIKTEAKDMISTKKIEKSSELEIEQITKESELEEVEIQTSQIEEQTVATEEKPEIKHEKRMEDLLNIEKELIQIYSGAQVQISDFYYNKEDLSEGEIRKSIQTKLKSLESIEVSEIESFGIPFALCKLESNYYTTIPINLGEIDLPTYMNGTRKNLKLINAGIKGKPELSENEVEMWDQAFNQFQLKLVQLVNKYAKEHLSKIQPKDVQMVEVDHIIIQEFIKEYEERTKNIDNYHTEILAHLTKIKDLLEENKSVWENKENQKEAKANLKSQLVKLEEEQTTIGKDTQIQYLKLRKKRKKLDTQTKKLKIVEKRKKEVPREEKEQLVKELREFQKKKDELQQNIQRTKNLETILENWLEIIIKDDENEVNEVFLKKFARSLKRKIEELLKNQDTEDIREKIDEHQIAIDNITLHVIYIPVALIHFKAKQDNKEIAGKLLYLSPTKGSILL